MEELQLEPVINHVKHYQNNWINHLHRMHRDRIPKVMLHYRPNGKRSLGRPKKRWIENSTVRITSSGEKLTKTILSWLFNDAISTTRLFSVDEIGDSEMIFGEISQEFAIDYLEFNLRLGKTSEKAQPGDQPKRGSNPRSSATSDRQTSALTD
ncbi:hypothetical protein ANN_11612 [Periplaneta americana]|uniref:Uncharacterized protein n=1 Tax=Periplaneta americana TaxID=6978 RepID=A0ABQ8T6W5_PERAM|nr:hypothetical protein ANN_11612 [Periplaneta americana]